jgi:fibronectin-binding autotransporter adhesin
MAGVALACGGRLLAYDLACLKKLARLQPCGRILKMRNWMLFVTSFVLLTPLSATAQTWDGGGATNAWTEGNNWNTNFAPANNGTATPNFAGNLRLTPTLDVTVDVAGLTFDNSSGAFNLITLNGSSLVVRGGGITNNNPSTAQTISPTIFLIGSQTWGGAGGLTLAGAVSLATNSLTINSAGTVGFGNVISGSGSLVKNGAGATVLNGGNTFTGGVTLNSGILAVGINTGLGTGALTINGGTFEGTGGSRTLANTVHINNDFGIVTGTGVNFTGTVNVNGARTLTNNITNFAITGSLGQTVAGSELTLAGTGNLTLSGTALTLGTSLKQNSGTLTATGLVNSSGRTLTQNGGTFAGSLINRGNFIFNGGTHSGNIANEAGGEANFNANLTLTAAFNNFGTVRVASARTLTFGTQNLNNAGTIELAGGTLSASGATTFASSGVISGFGTITTNNTSFANTGQIGVSGGNLTLASNFAFTNAGTISVPTGRQLQWNSAASFGNTGVVQLTGGTIAGTGSISNNVGGEIRGGGAIQSALSNIGGLVRATGSDPLVIANLSGNNTAGGELRVDDGATMTIQNTFNSSGTIVLGGSGATLNLNSVTNAGTLRGQGRVTGATLNSGVVRAEAGTLTFAGSANTNTAAGRLEAGPAAQILYTQGLVSNAGLIALTGGAFDNNNVALTNPGRIEGYGTVRTGGLTNSGAISVGGELDVIGPVTNSGTVSASTGSAIRFFGPVSGAGSFTGAGAVTFLNTFSPGASPATVTFGGDVALEGASNLVIELGGTSPGSQYDTLAVTGEAQVGGALDIDLLGNFVPAIGSVYQIVSSAGGVTGKFSTASLPTLANASWQLVYEPNAVQLRVTAAGDFNFDSRVDAADYTLWRDSLGQSGAALLADANGNGQVDAGDFGTWKSRFGQSAGGGSGGVTGGAVPEPMSALLALVGALGVLAVASRRAR